MSILDMNTLAAGRPVGLAANEGGRMMECAVVSFESAGHSALPRLQFDYPSGAIFHDLAGPSVTQQMRKTHRDLKVAVESGACGVAILLAEVCEGLTLYERSPADGGHFDYYMIPAALTVGSDPDNFFADATHVMEVSGVLNNGMLAVEKRVKEKLNRFANRPPDLPAFIIVIEFSIPYSKMVLV